MLQKQSCSTQQRLFAILKSRSISNAHNVVLFISRTIWPTPTTPTLHHIRLRLQLLQKAGQYKQAWKIVFCFLRMLQISLHHQQIFYLQDFIHK